jgi:hypothetical protein
LEKEVIVKDDVVKLIGERPFLQEGNEEEIAKNEDTTKDIDLDPSQEVLDNEESEK